MEQSKIDAFWEINFSMGSSAFRSSAFAVMAKQDIDLMHGAIKCIIDNVKPLMENKNTKNEGESLLNDLLRNRLNINSNHEDQYLKSRGIDNSINFNYPTAKAIILGLTTIGENRPDGSGKLLIDNKSADLLMELIKLSVTSDDKRSSDELLLTCANLLNSDYLAGRIISEIPHEYLTRQSEDYFMEIFEGADVNIHHSDFCKSALISFNIEFLRRITQSEDLNDKIRNLFNSSSFSFRNTKFFSQFDFTNPEDATFAKSLIKKLFQGFNRDNADIKSRAREIISNLKDDVFVELFVDLKPEFINHFYEILSYGDNESWFYNCQLINEKIIKNACVEGVEFISDKLQSIFGLNQKNTNSHVDKFMLLFFESINNNSVGVDKFVEFMGAIKNSGTNFDAASKDYYSIPFLMAKECNSSLALSKLMAMSQAGIFSLDAKSGPGGDASLERFIKKHLKSEWSAMKASVDASQNARRAVDDIMQEMNINIRLQ